MHCVHHDVPVSLDSLLFCNVFSFHCVLSRFTGLLLRFVLLFVSFFFLSASCLCKLRVHKRRSRRSAMGVCFGVCFSFGTQFLCVGACLHRGFI